MTDHRNISLTPAGPPQVERPNPAIFEAMGQDAIFRMIDDFYALLAESEIAFMFPEDMQTASAKSGAFFVGLLGGPPLYHQRHGSPMLRARHMPFPIDMHARDVWLACFMQVLKDAPARYGFPAEHLPGFIEFLDKFSVWMINSPRNG